MLMFSKKLPPQELMPTQLKRAVKVLLDLEQDWALTGQGHDAKVRERDRASRLDAEAHAKALTNGGKDPGTPRRDKLEKEISALEARTEALRIALSGAEADVTAVIDKHRERWLEAAREKAVARREVYAAEIEALLVSRQEVAREDAMVRYLSAWPDVKGLKASLGVSTLHGINADAYPLDLLFEALRVDANGSPVSAEDAKRFREREDARRSPDAGLTREEQIARARKEVEEKDAADLAAGHVTKTRIIGAGQKLKGGPNQVIGGRSI